MCPHVPVLLDLHLLFPGNGMAVCVAQCRALWELQFWNNSGVCCCWGRFCLIFCCYSQQGFSPNLHGCLQKKKEEKCPLQLHLQLPLLSIAYCRSRRSQKVQGEAVERENAPDAFLASYASEKKYCFELPWSERDVESSTSTSQAMLQSLNVCNRSKYCNISFISSSSPKRWQKRLQGSQAVNGHFQWAPASGRSSGALLKLVFLIDQLACPLTHRAVLCESHFYAYFCPFILQETQAPNLSL